MLVFFIYAQKKPQFIFIIKKMQWMQSRMKIPKGWNKTYNKTLKILLDFVQ